MSYRNDQDALYQRADDATREAERLRAENQAIRAVVAHRPMAVAPYTLNMQPDMVYQLLDVRTLPLEERARLAAHAVKRFPAWLMFPLSLLTFGLFPLIYFGLQHDRLPRSAFNDPTSGQAIGYQFIPFYNLYWIFFNSLRLCDRLSLQFKLRGMPDRAPRGLVLATCIVGVIPYVGMLAYLLMWPITNCLLQSTVNKVAALPPQSWDATVADYGAQPGYGAPQYGQGYPG